MWLGRERKRERSCWDLSEALSSCVDISVKLFWSQFRIRLELQLGLGLFWSQFQVKLGLKSPGVSFDLTWKGLPVLKVDISATTPVAFS